MEISVFTYKIPFVVPFQTAAAQFNYREGIFIQLEKDGITALGEAAPLPGFSTESMQGVLKQIKKHRRAINAHFASSFSLSDTGNFMQSHPAFPPSLQFALFTLAAVFLAQKKKTSLQELLLQSSKNSVAVNRVIGADVENRIEKVRQAVKKGFKTIKLKAANNWMEFLNDIETIHQQYPAITIRIDANQSWTLEQAARVLQQLEPYHIECCEEPLNAPNLESFQRLCELSPVPLALDESIFHSFTLAQAFRIAPVLIVKPMVWGLPLFENEFKKNVRKHHTKLIFTTSLECGIGRLMTAALAAGLGNSNAAHGLATGKRLAEDLWTDDDFIKNGRFYLPDSDPLRQLLNEPTGGIKSAIRPSIIS